MVWLIIVDLRSAVTVIQIDRWIGDSINIINRNIDIVMDVISCITIYK